MKSVNHCTSTLVFVGVWLLSAFAVGLAYAEGPAVAPSAVRDVLEQFYSACTAGDLDKAVSLCCLPFLNQKELQENEKDLQDGFRQPIGQTVRILAVTVVDKATLLPLLPGGTREFLADADLIVRPNMRVVNQDLDLTSDTLLVIMRKREDQWRLAGWFVTPRVFAKAK